MAHVFIVDEKTFKVHLEYMFAGTGNDFDGVYTFFVSDTDNTDEENKYDGTQDDQRAVQMISDITRIRKGDKIIFYVQGIGKFYGVFKAKSDFFFNDETDNYLKNDNKSNEHPLNKILTYRVLIEPDIVFEKGITEYDFLTSTKNVNTPQDMCWSLIYRKLRASRGCTPIFDFEFNKFLNIIQTQEEQRILDNTFFSFQNEKIINVNNGNEYIGNKIDINERLFINMKLKKKANKAFEHYLQQNVISKIKSTDYQEILFNDFNVTWIGNEVSCGVGMQKIDVMTIQEKEYIIVSLVELKYCKPDPIKIVEQIDKYLLWLFDYVIPVLERKDKKIIVQPIIIADKYKNNNKQINLEAMIKATVWGKYNTRLTEVIDTKYIKFCLEQDKVSYFI